MTNRQALTSVSRVISARTAAVSARAFDALGFGFFGFAFTPTPA